MSLDGSGGKKKAFELELPRTSAPGEPI
eukprot:SAG31_NODE_42410_length_271_cov_4.389535_2_plen_27_part_01